MKPGNPHKASSMLVIKIVGKTLHGHLKVIPIIEEPIRLKIGDQKITSWSVLQDDKLIWVKNVTSSGAFVAKTSISVDLSPNRKGVGSTLSTTVRHRALNCSKKNCDALVIPQNINNLITHHNVCCSVLLKQVQRKDTHQFLGAYKWRQQANFHIRKPIEKTN
jgi:hypothetical protein